jgi:DNA processing protein
MASPDHALLARVPSLDAARWCALAAELDSPLALTRLDAAALARHGLTLAGQRTLASFDAARHASDLDALQRHAIQLVAANEAAYPAALHAVPGAPAVLFVRGSIDALSAPQLAMVGSRHPTINGARTARDLAFHFASLGLAITSGLATGIDAASHGGALAAQGVTIAVCGTSLDRIYPEQHTALAERILSRGALVSEFPPGSPPLARHVVQRNRLISGLALGVLVVEAAARSGSLNTARYAGEQGREVFAIPGSIHSPQSRGCHQLLRQGATLVENADDVLRELKNFDMNHTVEIQPEAPEVWHPESPRLDNPTEILLDALGFEPTSLDALIASTGLSSITVASLLLALEHQGRVASDSAGRYYRTLESPL